MIRAVNLRGQRSLYPYSSYGSGCARAVRWIGLWVAMAGLAVTSTANGEAPLFDLDAIRDVPSLQVKVLEDWHIDSHAGNTRQKLIEITVAEWWPGFDYRVPVRLVVPLDKPATGLHLTSHYAWSDLAADAQLDALDSALIAGGVGVVYTVVAPLPELPDGPAIDRAMFTHLFESHSVRYTPFWIWPMTLMRAVTAAFSETDYILPGKVASSGRSKNGAAPATALIEDDRFTALCATVAPPYGSPARHYAATASDAIMRANEAFSATHADDDVDGTGLSAEVCRTLAGYGMHDHLRKAAEGAGWTTSEFHHLMEQLAPHVLVADRWEELMARNVAVLYQPGTHDWVAYDILWGAQNHPEIPVYNKANFGHNQVPHPAAETDDRNRDALFLNHFFGGPDRLLRPPVLVTERTEKNLRVRVAFSEGPQPTRGRVWWIYDRDPGGSIGYLWKRIPDDQWKEMTLDPTTGEWTVDIAIDDGHTHIEVFSNHGLTVEGMSTYLSSPYTRVEL